MRFTMKTSKKSGLATGLLIAVLLVTACGQENRSAQKDSAKTAGKGFAVLELFTSEGCSSCPPADKLLTKIQQESKGKAVYLLAYHVDYWDRLGWKDPFSQADFSKRQSRYAKWLGSHLYTPQLIVNGKAGLVGSNEPAIRNAIERELVANPVATLTLQAHQEGEKLKVNYQVTQAVKSGRLLIAIVQKNAQSKVERGENAGRTLSHVQIVHAVQNEPLSRSGAGNTDVALPKDFTTQNWEVLGLLQDPNNGEILGAAKAELNDRK